MPHKLEKIRAAGGVRRRAPAQTAFYSNAEGVERPLEEGVHFPLLQGRKRYLSRTVEEGEHFIVERGRDSSRQAGHDEGHIQPLAHHLLIGADEVADLGGRGLQLIYQDERPRGLWR